MKNKYRYQKYNQGKRIHPEKILLISNIDLKIRKKSLEIQNWKKKDIRVLKLFYFKDKVKSVDSRLVKKQEGHF